MFIIGAGGKSGLLCAYEAKKRVKPTGKVICLVHGDAGRKRLEKAGFADVIIQGSATDQLFVYEEVKKATDGEMADLTINCVDIPNTEMASILATKDDGMVYFFSMATSFTSAALGAEGIGADTLDDHRQRLHQGPRRDLARGRAREPDPHGDLQGAPTPPAPATPSR